MNKIWGNLLTIFFLSLVVANYASANEGRIILKNGTLSCEGVSLWRNDRYRLVGRCNGLVYPYQERLANYVLWAQAGGEAQPDRVDSIEVGYFDGQTDEPFERIFITVEETSSPRQPSDLIIASGNILRFDFPTPDLADQAVVAQAPLPTPTPTPPPAGGPTPVLSNLTRVLITIPIVIVVVAIVAFALIALLRRGQS